MRLYEIQQLVTELRMNPAFLRQAVAGLQGIRAGMEFEMYVPGVLQSTEPDYGPDRRVDLGDWQQDLWDFFTDPEADYPVSQRKMQRALDRAQSDFTDWVAEEAQCQLEQELEQDPDLDEGDRLEELLSELEDDWSREHVYTMRDFSEQYLDYYWPHQKLMDLTLEDLKPVAAELQDWLGDQVQYSDRYKGVPRPAPGWILEPDGSLDEPRAAADAGLELVSPTLTLQQLLQTLPRVYQWARDRGAYTNSTCGLHMNISMPGYGAEQLDPMKFLLLSGDDHMLRRFERYANDFASSYNNYVEDALTLVGLTELDLWLERMRTGARQIITPGLRIFSQRLSIYFRSDRIEVRTPGGNWLAESPEEIELVLLRYVVTLAAALDPDWDRQTYLKKLHALMQRVLGPNSDASSLFAQQLAGKISRQQLRQQLARLKQQRLQRQQTEITRT